MTETYLPPAADPTTDRPEHPNTGLPGGMAASSVGYMPPGVTQPVASNKYPDPNRPWNPATNGYAIASLVLGLVGGFGIGSILAIVFGAIARSQTVQNNQKGRTMATWGLWLGIIGVAIVALLVIAMVASSGDTSYGACVDNAGNYIC